MPKLVLITGASSGFGEACARKFASEGANLILAARRLAKLEELAAQLPADTEVVTTATGERLPELEYSMRVNWASGLFPKNAVPYSST